MKKTSVLIAAATLLLVGACKRVQPATTADTGAPGTAMSAADAGPFSLPLSVYAALEDADKLGKAGDAENMLKAALTDLGNPENYTVSPDRKKVVVGAGKLYAAELKADPGEEAVFYFEAGKGLTGWKAKAADVRKSVWSEDNRYVTFAGEAQGLVNDLYITDTESWKDTHIGTVARVDDGYEWEIANGFVVWLSYTPATWGAAVPQGYYLPELRAYNLANTAKHQALRAYAETLRQEGGDVKIELKITPETTPEIAETPLYKKYADKYFTCKKVGG